MNAPETLPVNRLIQQLPQRLKLSELRVFVTVLEHRSFRKAAAVLHLSQPAVTKTISTLEATLGTRLFHRVPNGVEPTVHGRSFAPRAAAVFNELRRAAQDLTLLDSGAAGSLRVGTVPMPHFAFLPLVVSRLAAQRPGIFVAMFEALETELMDRLRNRDIELAIMRLPLVELGEDIRCTPLFEETLYVLAHKDHPLASRTTLTWPELLAETWVMSPADCVFFRHVKRSLEQLGLPMPRHTVEVQPVHVIYSLLVHGGMLTFALGSDVNVVPHRDMLVRLPFELPLPSRTVAALSLKSHTLSPLADQLIDEIKTLVASR